MISAGLQAPFRQQVDQTELKCGERTAQDPLQTKFGKIPLPSGHELPVVRREKDVLTLPCDNGCRHCKHLLDNYPIALGLDSGR